MRKVDEKSVTEMSPAARTIIAFEKNGAVDVPDPQQLFADVLAENPNPVRWEQGVAFFRFADVLEATRNPAIISNDPVTGRPMGMGSEEPPDPAQHRRVGASPVSPVAGSAIRPPGRRPSRA